MKLFNIFRRRERKAPLAPIHTMRPPGEARAERQAQETAEAEARARATSPEIDSVFMDTDQLALDSGAEDSSANPYDSHTWEMDHEGGLRRVADQSVANRDRNPDESGTGNPYDSQKMRRRGW